MSLFTLYASHNLGLGHDKVGIRAQLVGPNGYKNMDNLRILLVICVPRHNVQEWGYEWPLLSWSLLFKLS